jgi:hypothetical protein
LKHTVQKTTGFRYVLRNNSPIFRKNLWFQKYIFIIFKFQQRIFLESQTRSLYILCSCNRECGLDIHHYDFDILKCNLYTCKCDLSTLKSDFNTFVHVKFLWVISSLWWKMWFKHSWVRFRCLWVWFWLIFFGSKQPRFFQSLKFFFKCLSSHYIRVWRWLLQSKYITEQ